MNTEQRTQLIEILRPNFRKVVLTFLLAILMHAYLVAAAAREATTEQVHNIQQFWLTNFFHSLPFLQSSNTALKFTTFFVGSYVVVWIGSIIFGILDRAQLAAIKRLRRTHG